MIFKAPTVASVMTAFNSAISKLDVVIDHHTSARIAKNDLANKLRLEARGHDDEVTLATGVRARLDELVGGVA